CMQPLEFLRTF
nr:immunoglobulin light chain junction region [Macaca mulatta]